jgi:hypothetical protein
LVSRFPSSVPRPDGIGVSGPRKHSLAPAVPLYSIDSCPQAEREASPLLLCGPNCGGVAAPTPLHQELALQCIRAWRTRGGRETHCILRRQRTRHGVQNVSIFSQNNGSQMIKAAKPRRLQAF